VYQHKLNIYNLQPTSHLMNHRRTCTSFLSTLEKSFTLVFFIGLLASCKKENLPREKEYSLASGYSIFVNNGSILVSGLNSENGRFTTKYWINGENAEQSRFILLLKNQLGYRQAVDEKYRTGYSYKDKTGQIKNYRFGQGNDVEKGWMYYYQDNALVRLANDKLGALTAVTFLDDKPIFTGSLGEMAPNITGGLSYRPKTAFIWDGQSALKELPIPAQSTLFWGVSTIYSNASEEVYVGGLCGVPMFWKNTEPIVLDKRFGEVWQITKSGSDVYAVGLISKSNSNSGFFTACFWKNGVLTELQDNAQAYGIFLDGNDVYVTGSVGDVPVNYRPCYWENGVRVDLPM
jgi:hypothetical protein